MEISQWCAFVRYTSLHCNRSMENALKHAFLHYLLIKVQLKANRHPTFMGQSARAPPIPTPTHHDPGSQNMKWRALFDDRRMERISFVQRIDYRQPRSMPLDPKYPRDALFDLPDDTLLFVRNTSRKSISCKTEAGISREWILGKGWKYGSLRPSFTDCHAVFL